MCNKEITISIYSGVVPSTTFIERLIIGLAQNGIRIILFGKLNSKVIYPQRNIVVHGNRDGIYGLIQFLLRLTILLIKHPNRYKSLKHYLQYGPFANKHGYHVWQKYIPVLLNLPDIFHVQWAKAAEEWLFLKELFGVKLVLSLRGTHINTSPLADAALAESYRRSFCAYDAFHAVSHAIAREATQYGAAQERIQIIYSIISDSFYDAFEPERNPVRLPLSIISVGRFHWKKGYDYGIQALRILQLRGIKTSYTIVAGNDCPENLKYLVHDNQLENCVRFIKNVPHDQVIELIKAHSVFLLPSLEEGIANVVLEAMAAGVPVVSTSAGGMSEVIKDNETGWLAPIADAQALADALEKYAQVSVEELQVIRRNAFDQVWNNNRKESQVNKFIAFYTRVLKEEAA